MEADRRRPDRARTTASRPDTHTPAQTDRDVPDAEALDHLKRHDPSRTAASTTGTMARWHGDQVRWVRASDALAQTSGRATGRGITWTAQANRLPRLAPLRQAGTGRRAIARASATPRGSRLAPISAFGTRPASPPSVGPTGVSR